MFQLQFDVMGDQQVVRGFSRFAESVKDLSEPFKQIVQDFHEIEKKQFDSEGGYGSGGWQPLASSTIEQKQRQGWPLKIMVRTGDLRDVMTGGRSGYEDIQPLELKIMMLAYGKYHQSTAPRTKLPRRPLIELTESDKTRWTKIIHQYLVDESRKAFADLMPTIGAGTSHLKAIQEE